MMRAHVRCAWPHLRRILAGIAVALVVAATDEARSASASDSGIPDVVRFLEQSTYGPTAEPITRALALASPAYLEEQLALEASRYDGFPYVPPTASSFCPAGANGQADSVCNRDYY